MLKKNWLSIVAVVAVAIFIFSNGAFLGFRYGERFPKTIIVKETANTETPTSTQADFGTFWQAWGAIQDNYLRDASTTSQDKVYGAIKGLVLSLRDPYSNFFTPEEGKRFQDDIRGNFGGIGAELGIRKGGLVIVAPLKNTPASRAGLLAGDQILKINSTSTDGLSLDEAVSIIRGPEGTNVTLSIMRKGWDKPKDFHITRERITVPTIDLTMKEGGIAHLQLYSFNANTDFLFYQAMAQAVSEKARGIVLDLRNNSGGYLNVAVNIAGWFLPRGTLVVSEEGKTGVTDKFYAEGNSALEKVPVVVLINGGSASASEILAGALRDNRHALLVGEQSFGKGTVQRLEELRDGSSLKLTIAHWVLPSGHTLDNNGLKPDVEVKITDNDTQNKRDPQLEKALELVKKEIGAESSLSNR